jgi:hypothetical protein
MVCEILKPFRFRNIRSSFILRNFASCLNVMRVAAMVAPSDAVVKGDVRDFSAC